MSDEESDNPAPMLLDENVFSLYDAVQVISDKLRSGERVHFPLGEHWIAVLTVLTPKIPADGDMATIVDIQVCLEIAIPKKISRSGFLVSNPEGILPDVMVFGKPLGLYGAVYSIEGVCNSALIRHKWFHGDTLSDAVKKILEECCSIFSKIKEFYDTKRRLEQSRKESIERALDEHARRMSL